MSLNPGATPDLIDQDPPATASSNQSSAASPGGKTLFLKIDLELKTKPKKGEPAVKGPVVAGKPVVPMTAVFAPDPKQLTAGDVDVLLWFHGDKKVWSRKRKGDLELFGKSIQDYLQVDECKLREFILQSTKKRKFLLVAPTLNDFTGHDYTRNTAGGLLWQQNETEAFLKQVLNGVKKYMGINVTGTGNIVLAAHSGGGHVMDHMAQYFTGPFTKANEVWCFDCTYWGGDPFTDWANKGHSPDPRLWVYSTGGAGNGLTGDSAKNILDFADARTAAAKTTTIEVLIDDYPKDLKDPTKGSKSFSTKGFDAAYHGSANGHYESIEKYLPQLVEKSKNLQ